MGCKPCPMSYKSDSSYSKSVSIKLVCLLLHTKRLHASHLIGAFSVFSTHSLIFFLQLKIILNLFSHSSCNRTLKTVFWCFVCSWCLTLRSVCSAGALAVMDVLGMQSRRMKWFRDWSSCLTFLDVVPVRSAQATSVLLLSVKWVRDHGNSGFGQLYLCCHFINRKLESLFIFLSNNILFLKIMHLLNEQHN